MNERKKIVTMFGMAGGAGVMGVMVVMGVVCLLLGGCVQSDEDGAYPVRPIKVVVPFAPGGGSDTFTHVLKKAIEDEGLLDQPLVVINVNGAGGTIGSRRVKNARPDGYTMLMLHEGILTAKYSGNAEYGPEAFDPIAGTGQVDMVLAVAEGSEFKGLGDLMAEAVRAPDTIAFGANMGAPSHFVGLLMEHAQDGAVFRYTQTGGGADRFASLIGGDIAVSAFSVEEYLRYQAAGLRALCLFGVQRHKALPDLETAREQGFDVVSSNMHFWWFPKGTAPEYVTVVADALGRAMQNEEVLKTLAESQTLPTFLKGAELDAALAKRTTAISKVSMRQTEGLPDFPKMVGMILLVLVGFVVWGEMRGAKKEVEEKEKGRMGLALGCVGLTFLYIAVMGMGWVGYKIATVVFVGVLGGTLCRWERRRWVGLGAMALVMGVGFYWLFTSVFVIDLP